MDHAALQDRSALSEEAHAADILSFTAFHTRSYMDQQRAKGAHSAKDICWSADEPSALCSNHLRKNSDRVNDVTPRHSYGASQDRVTENI